MRRPSSSNRSQAKAGIPNARRVVLPGVGHLMYLEKPEEFSHLVIDFIEQNKELNPARRVWRQSFEQRSQRYRQDNSPPLSLPAAAGEHFRSYC